ncbi:hypothetical protein GCM10011314_33640 [Knoellia flava]|uniref:Uncharacterized protein n=1 Tax=Knoellia flava TaxID=913969 RepID=A0A8H9KS02_9MICO|nr:hypothetical protein GCM10011314_33640 [Knoellia flava]
MCARAAAGTVTDAVALGDAEAEPLGEADGLAVPDALLEPDPDGVALGFAASPSAHPASARQAAVASATAYDMVELDRIGTLPLTWARPRARTRKPSTNWLPA